MNELYKASSVDSVKNMDSLESLKRFLVACISVAGVFVVLYKVAQIYFSLHDESTLLQQGLGYSWVDIIRARGPVFILDLSSLFTFLFALVAFSLRKRLAILLSFVSLVFVVAQAFLLYKHFSTPIFDGPSADSLNSKLSNIFSFYNFFCQKEYFVLYSIFIASFFTYKSNKSFKATALRASP